MSKDSIEVWNIQFYKIDDNGRMLLNADGSPKLFEFGEMYRFDPEVGLLVGRPDIDVSDITDHVHDDDLVECSNHDQSMLQIVIDDRPMNEWG
jgi:hypothetical protein